MGRVRVIERQRFLFKIEDIYGTALGAESISNMMYNGTRDRIAIQAADDGENV